MGKIAIDKSSKTAILICCSLKLALLWNRPRKAFVQLVPKQCFAAEGGNMKINTKELEFWWFTIVIVTTGVLILELFTGNSNSVNNLYLAAYVANCALFIAVSARLKDAQKGNIEIISPLFLTALIYIKLYLFYQLNPKEVGSDLQEIGVALRNSRGVTTEGYRSIDTVGDYLYQFMMELYRGDTKLPLEAKARLYIFYFEYCPLVRGLRKATR